jgi:hypothetical protein
MVLRVAVHLVEAVPVVVVEVRPEAARQGKAEAKQVDGYVQFVPQENPGGDAEIVL